MKIEKEIKKIIKDYAWTNEEGKSVLMEKEDIDNAVSELTNLFKTYARSLVPKSIKVRKFSREDAYDYAHRVFQEMREEILRRIEGE